MLGRASPIAFLEILSAPQALFPFRSLQQKPAFHLITAKFSKIPSYRTNKSVKNGVARVHLIAGGLPTYSKKLKLLGKPVIIEGSSAKPYSAGEVPKPDSPPDEEAIEGLEYYEPRVGDFVIGVVVSGNGNRLEINIGSAGLARMYLSEVLHNNKSQMDRISCELPTDSYRGANYAAAADGNGCNLIGKGMMGILKEKEAIGDGWTRTGTSPIEEGTILYAQVLGRTLSGESLLSSRRFARRVAWQRVKQINEENEPIEIYISEWNTGGLISRIEGLRAFLPKGEMVNIPFDNFAALKENVGKKMSVLIKVVNEASEELIVSERLSWKRRNFYEGNLLQGTIKRVFSYGAEVNIDGTSISGLLHISNISCAQVSSVASLFSEGEKVKVMVVSSNFQNKATFSTADLESEGGLILTNKKKVFEEAEQIAAAYRSKLGTSFMHVREDTTDYLDKFDESDVSYANWDWFKFEPDVRL